MLLTSQKNFLNCLLKFWMLYLRSEFYLLKLMLYSLFLRNPVSKNFDFFVDIFTFNSFQFYVQLSKEQQLCCMLASSLIPTLPQLALLCTSFAIFSFKAISEIIFYYMSVTFWNWLLNDVVILHFNFALYWIIDAWITAFSSLLHAQNHLIHRLTRLTLSKNRVLNAHFCTAD